MKGGKIEEFVAIPAEKSHMSEVNATANTRKAVQIKGGKKAMAEKMEADIKAHLKDDGNTNDENLDAATTTKQDLAPVAPKPKAHRRAPRMKKVQTDRSDSQDNLQSLTHGIDVASGEPKLPKVKARSPKQPATRSRDQQSNTGFIHEQASGMAPVGMLSTPIQPQWDMNGGLFTNITEDYLLDKTPANPNTTAGERYLLEDDTLVSTKLQP